MSVLNFKPKQVTKKFLSVLPERVRDVVVERFGLGTDGKRKTLESIGKKYGVTRERIRQIEDFGLKLIRKSDVYTESQDIFDDLHKVILSYAGGVVAEKDFFDYIKKDADAENHIYFLLVLGDKFEKRKEDNAFTHRWVVDKTISDSVHLALEKLSSGLKEEDLIPEEELLSVFLGHLTDIPEEYKKEEYARRWLALSKAIGANPLGEWGITKSPNVNARGIKDFAFLVIRRHGSPMHFTEVANAIQKSFGKKAHVATCHNELIKDKRFVLVGRGLYALSDWGYAKGIVRDVVKDILANHGPLTKDEIIEKVMKERYVKPNTIVVNLQNNKYFKKNKEGKYILVGVR